MLGVPGSGKSFSTKREITNAFLITGDDIIISDPEAEYASLVGALHGQVVRISQGSRDHVNPMDINVNYPEDDDPVRLKSDFLIGLCELIVGSRDGLEGDEKSLIDAAVQNVYRAYFATAAYSVEIWKRCRKWGGIPTGITHNVKDLLASREVENIFEDLCCKGWMSNPPLS